MATREILVRPYRTADQAAIRALHDRTPPAGQNLVAAQPWPPDLDRIAAAYLAFWVAVEQTEPSEPVVGMVGMQTPGDEVPAAVWRGRVDIVQLKRMRVAPERQRRGIGSRLLDTAIAWARREGYSAIILETTPAQEAAIDLYRSAGFTSAGRSTLGAYALVWFELPLALAVVEGWQV